MKKIMLITLLITMGVVKPTFCQISLNLSMGINHSNCKFENFSEISPEGRLGYFFGVAPSYQVGTKIQLQMNFEYSLKGYSTGVENNLTPSDFRYRYLDIMPEMEYSISEYVTIGVGINYGIKIDEQFKFPDGGWSHSDNYETIKSTDFGLTGKLKVHHKRISAFVRYNIGLKDIGNVTFTDENGQNRNAVRQLNRNFQIGIGYELDFKK